MKFMSQVLPEIISRSVCLFREYHGLYEDDYEGVFYWDPVSGEFGADYWTTAGACAVCPDVDKFAMKPWEVYEGALPEEWEERIKAGLREHIKDENLKKEFIRNFVLASEHKYNQYSYQKAGWETVLKSFDKNWEAAVDKIDDLVYLLRLCPECSSGSYKNDKETLRWAAEKRPAYKTLTAILLEMSDGSLIPKRERKAASVEGMTRFEGEVISVKSEMSTYGLRSDWKEIHKVGVRMENGKSFWFTAPKNYKPERGQRLEVFSKDFTEYARSFQLRRPVVNVLD